MKAQQLIWRMAQITFVAVCAGAALAATFIVDDNGPADFSTVQSAINAASNGDEIIVRPGRYRETVRFLGKSITVRSEQGPLNTIIFLEGETRIVEIDGNATLRGFTITGGQRQTGAGILVTGNVTPMIEDNIIEGNTALWDSFLGPGRGAGISIEAPAEPMITRNVIRDNVAQGDPTGFYGLGGAIEIGDYASATITSNLIVNNQATDTGGGLYVGYNAGTTTPVVITNNTFVGNRAGNGAANNFSFGGGMSLYDGSFATIQNNLFADNMSSYMGGGVYFYPNNDNNFNYDNNDYDNNTPTNCEGLPASKCDGGQFFLPASFIDPATGRFRLSSASDMIDLGISGAEGSLDADGRTRTVDGDLDGISAPDIGAYENQGEITRLAFTDAVTLTWDGSSNTAMSFDIYQDTLDTLTLGNSGICWQSGVGVTTTSINPDPPVGVGWFFLVGGKDIVVGTLGFDSQGIERVPIIACP